MTRRTFAVSLTLASLAAAAPLPVSTPEKEGFSPARLERMHEALASMVREGKRSGAVSLILRNGRVVDFRAWGWRDLEAKLPMEHDTICRIASMTKPVTSAAVLALYEEGRFQLTDPVERYIPELKGLRVLEGGTAEDPYLVPANSPVTIKHLLTHTSGMVYAYGESPVELLYRQAAPMDAPTLREMVLRISALPLIAHPGRKWQYGMSTDVLGYLVETVSGMPFDRFLQQRILDPLGMKDTHFVAPVEKNSRVAKTYTLEGARLTPMPYPLRRFPSGGGGLFSTPMDYGRFCQMLLNGGQLEGARVLGRKTVELMLANHLNHLDPPTLPGSAGEGFGLGGSVRLDLPSASTLGSVGQFGWSGAASTWFRIDPREKLAAILFMQHLPMDGAACSLYSTLVYQALAE